MNKEDINDYERKKIELINKRAVAYSHKERVNEAIRKLGSHFRVAHIDDNFTFSYYDGFWHDLEDFSTEFNEFMKKYSEYQELAKEYDTFIESNLRGQADDKN